MRDPEDAAVNVDMEPEDALRVLLNTDLSEQEGDAQNDSEYAAAGSNAT